MSFPPHDVIQDFMMLHLLESIADDVNELIAGTGLTADIADMRGSHYVSVPLTNGGAVVLWANTRFPGAWVTAWPTPSRSDVTQVPWPLETDTNLVAKITASVVTEALQGRDLPTPFRWGRVETSAIVELADQLIARGVDRDAIQITPLRTLDDDGRPRSVHGNRHELRLSDKYDSDRSLYVRINPTHGWSVDQVMPQTGGSGRLDLAAALELETALPRVGADDVPLGVLAQVLIDDIDRSNPFEDDDNIRQLRRYDLTPDETGVYSKSNAERAAIAWLRWVGFIPPDRRGGREALSPAVELHVDYTDKQIGLGGVQRYKGVASVGGRTPIVVARAGFSKRARAWANTAEMLLFTIAEDGLLHPANDLAEGYTPREIGLRPKNCDDPACSIGGCVQDNDVCSTNWGRYRDPQAERLRL